MDSFTDNIDALPSSLLDPESNLKKKKKSGGFQSMNLIYPIYKAILSKGFNVPTPIQRKTIPLILEGRDVIASSKTGSGKTAAYMIPLLNRLKAHSSIVGARALILLPTRELALQTAAVFKQFAKYTDLNHAIIVGGHGFEGQYESLASNPDVIIATPGRLMQHLEETNLSLAKLEYLVIDEADHMLDMGFEEQLRAIVKKVPTNRQTILLSATIPEQVSEFAKIGLKDYVFVKLDSEYTIPDSMKLNFFLTKSQTKLSALLYFIREKLNLQEKTIIFAATRSRAYLSCLDNNSKVQVLKAFGLNSVGIYGKMDQLTRKDQILKFKRNECNLLVVTDLAARGIDIPFVSNVINWDFPTKPKVFIHRSGRTARAGRTGTTYTFLSPEEVLYLADLKLYIGRTFTTEGNPEDLALAHYGQIPEYLLDNYEEAIKNLLKNDIEIEKMFELCNKAIKLFKRTRAPASKSSIRGARALDQTAVHVLIRDKAYNADLEKMLEKLRNYKPKQSYLEFKNESGEIQIKNSALAFINQARSATEKRKKKQAQKQIIAMREAEKGQLEKKVGDECEHQEGMSVEGEDDEWESEISGNENDGDEEEQENENDEGLEEERIDGSLLQKRTYEKSTINGDWKKELVKKVKRSQIEDFRHPTQYISYEKSKNNPFEDKNKIGDDDIVPFVVADEADDLQKKQKYVWDKKKKKYIQKTGDSDKKGIKKDKEDKYMKEGKNKDLFKKWQKKNQLSYQKVGDIENKVITSKAKQMFLFRKKRHGAGGEEDGGKSANGKKSGNNRRKRGNELKNSEQILKDKKRNISKKRLNMQKEKRKHLISKKGKKR